MSATRATDAIGGLAVEIDEREQPARDLVEQGVGVLGGDDAVALATAQVEAHVALVLGRVREGAGACSSRRRAARGAR